MRMSSIVLLGLLALFLCSKPAHAASGYDNCTGFITSVPTVISTPGTWCLKQDVSTAITSGDAISVASDKVTIDCNDFTLDGLAAGSGSAALGIHALNRSRMTVRHCTVRGFYRGIHAEGTGGRHLVEDNHLDRNLLVGIKVEGGNSLIRHNLITRDGASTSTAAPYSAYGILAFDGATDIVDNTVSGMAVAAATNANVRGIATQNDVQGSITGNTIRGLTPDITGNVGGIVGNESSPMVIRDNQVVGDNHPGIGVECGGLNPPYPAVRVRANVVSGFETATIQDCGDAGENDATP
jgi:hypothetical protein